jgi:amidase
VSRRPVDCWVPDSAGLQPTRPGPLDGLTLAVKDLIAIEGRTSSFGHPRWRATHAPSASTAPVVSRLLAAGASAAGLAKLDQLAYSLIGNAGEGTPPLNSLYPGRFTGGSSSGPAAAVAAGLADVGLGTDTAGSIRVPAASCGLFGLRPTHGSVSSAGVLPLAPSFDVVGLLARSAGTLGRVLGLLSSSPDDARTPAAGRPVTVPADCLDGISAAAAQAVYATARQIASAAGCGFAECRLAGFISQDAADLFARIQARQVWQAHGPWLSQNGEALAADVRSRVERAAALSAGPQAQADDDEREWRSYQRGLGQALPQGSVIVLPVIPDLPPQRNASAAELSAFRAGALRYSAPASLAGRPELVIPVRHLASGTQLGIGLIGEANDDKALLRIASRLCGEHHQLAV